MKILSRRPSPDEAAPSPERPQPPQVVLEIREPSTAPRRVALSGSADVGRVEPGLCLDDPRVSRRHLHLDLTDAALRATDLGSRNGTRVNDQPLDGTVELRAGDVLSLGDSQLVLVAVPGSTSQQPPEPVRARPALDRLELRETEAAVFRFRRGTPGEAAVAALAPAVDRARKALAGLGSEPWGIRPQICLVDPFPDPHSPEDIVARGTFIDPEHGEIWMAVSAEWPPEPPGRSLALLFGAPLPAAQDLAVLLEGYGLFVSDLEVDVGLRDRPLPPLAEAEGELRARMALSFVRYLLERGGRDAFRRLLATAAPGRVDDAATDTYGLGLAGLEEAWRRSLVDAEAPRLGQFLRTARPYLRLNLAREVELSLYLLLQLSFSIGFPFALRSLLQHALPAHDLSQTRTIILLLTGLFAVSLVAGLRAGYVSSWISASVVRRVRTDMFARMQALSADWFARQQQGDVLSRLTNDVAVFEAGMSQTLRQGAFQLLSLLSALVVLMVLSWQLGLVVLVGAALVALVYRVMAPGAQRRSTEVQEQFGSLLSVAAENFAAHHVVRAFGLEHSEQTRFSRASDRLFGRQVRLAFFGSVFNTSVTGIVALLQLSVITVGAWFIFHDRLDVATFVVVMTQIGLVVAPVSALSAVGQQIQQSSGALRRINEVLAGAPTVAEVPDAPALGPLRSEIRFAHVSFSFTQERPTLVDVDLLIPAGSRVAFVGPTGAGKSALLQLLLRFYDVDDGAVLVDGVDIRGVTLSSLRGQIGVVLQDTFLFDASIRDNIALRAPVTNEQVEAVAHAAQLHDFIMSLPRGYDTRVGERGARLSGGQRQRLAIARALLRDPQVLVLDEATSALDPLTELRIVEQLQAASSGRTTISVTHRLTSVTQYDRLFVVLDGRVVEQGTHTELLALGGTYADMWRKQAGQVDQPPALDVVAALARVPLFHDVPDPVRAEVAGRLRERRLQPGEALLEGDGCLYLIAEGEARVLVPDSPFAPVVLARGDAFGLAALLRDESGARLQAVGAVTLLVLDAEDLGYLAATLPQVAAALGGSGGGLVPSGGSRLPTVMFTPRWASD